MPAPLGAAMAASALCPASPAGGVCDRQALRALLRTAQDSEASAGARLAAYRGLAAAAGHAAAAAADPLAYRALALTAARDMLTSEHVEASVGALQVLQAAPPGLALEVLALGLRRSSRASKGHITGFDERVLTGLPVAIDSGGASPVAGLGDWEPAAGAGCTPSEAAPAASFHEDDDGGDDDGGDDDDAATGGVASSFDDGSGLGLPSPGEEGWSDFERRVADTLRGDGPGHLRAAGVLAFAALAARGWVHACVALGAVHGMLPRSGGLPAPTALPFPSDSGTSAVPRFAARWLGCLWARVSDIFAAVVGATEDRDGTVASAAWVALDEAVFGGGSGWDEEGGSGGGGDASEATCVAARGARLRLAREVTRRLLPRLPLHLAAVAPGAPPLPGCAAVTPLTGGSGAAARARSLGRGDLSVRGAASAIKALTASLGLAYSGGEAAAGVGSVGAAAAVSSSTNSSAPSLSAFTAALASPWRAPYTLSNALRFDVGAAAGQPSAGEALLHLLETVLLPLAGGDASLCGVSVSGEEGAQMQVTVASLALSVVAGLGEAAAGSAGPRADAASTTPLPAPCWLVSSADWGWDAVRRKRMSLSAAAVAGLAAVAGRASAALQRAAPALLRGLWAARPLLLAGGAGPSVHLVATSGLSQQAVAASGARPASLSSTTSFRGSLPFGGGGEASLSLAAFAAGGAVVPTAALGSGSASTPADFVSAWGALGSSSPPSPPLPPAAASPAYDATLLACIALTVHTVPTAAVVAAALVQAAAAHAGDAAATLLAALPDASAQAAGAITAALCACVAEPRQGPAINVKAAADTACAVFTKAAGALRGLRGARASPRGRRLAAACCEILRNGAWVAGARATALGLVASGNATSALVPLATLLAAPASALPVPAPAIAGSASAAARTWVPAFEWHAVHGSVAAAADAQLALLSAVTDAVAAAAPAASSSAPASASDDLFSLGDGSGSGGDASPSASDGAAGSSSANLFATFLNSLAALLTGPPLDASGTLTLLVAAQAAAPCASSAAAAIGAPAVASSSAVSSVDAGALHDLPAFSLVAQQVLAAAAAAAASVCQAPATPHLPAAWAAVASMGLAAVLQDVAAASGAWVATSGAHGSGAGFPVLGRLAASAGAEDADTRLRGQASAGTAIDQALALAIGRGVALPGASSANATTRSPPGSTKVGAPLAASASGRRAAGPRPVLAPHNPALLQRLLSILARMLIPSLLGGAAASTAQHALALGLAARAALLAVAHESTTPPAAAACASRFVARVLDPALATCSAAHSLAVAVTARTRQVSLLGDEDEDGEGVEEEEDRGAGSSVLALQTLAALASALGVKIVSAAGASSGELASALRGLTAAAARELPTGVEWGTLHDVPHSLALSVAPTLSPSSPPALFTPSGISSLGVAAVSPIVAQTRIRRPTPWVQLSPPGAPVTLLASTMTRATGYPAVVAFVHYKGGHDAFALPAGTTLALRLGRASAGRVAPSYLPLTTLQRPLKSGQGLLVQAPLLLTSDVVDAAFASGAVRVTVSLPAVMPLAALPDGEEEEPAAAGGGEGAASLEDGATPRGDAVSAVSGPSRDASSVKGSQPRGVEALVAALFKPAAAGDASAAVAAATSATARSALGGLSLPPPPLSEPLWDDDGPASAASPPAMALPQCLPSLPLAASAPFTGSWGAALGRLASKRQPSSSGLSVWSGPGLIEAAPTLPLAGPAAAVWADARGVVRASKLAKAQMKALSAVLLGLRASNPGAGAAATRAVSGGRELAFGAPLCGGSASVRWRTWAAPGAGPGASGLGGLPPSSTSSLRRLGGTGADANDAGTVHDAAQEGTLRAGSVADPRETASFGDRDSTATGTVAGEGGGEGGSEEGSAAAGEGGCFELAAAGAEAAAAAWRAAAASASGQGANGVVPLFGSARRSFAALQVVL